MIDDISGPARVYDIRIVRITLAADARTADEAPTPEHSGAAGP